MGRLYLGLSFLAGVTAVPLSFRAQGGAAATAGFLLLSILWLRATWKAYECARCGNYARHLKWVRVHYLLAFAAVFQRWGLAAAAYVGIPVDAVAATLVWVSWQPGFWLGCWWKLWLTPSIRR